MVEDTGRPWKMTAIGMALVVVTAVIVGFLVAGWGPRAGLEALFCPVIAPAPPAAAHAEGRRAIARAGRRRGLQPVREGAGG